MHTKCGGAIDKKTRTCSKCGKKWNLFSYWLSTGAFRPVTIWVEKEVKKPTTYASWADKLPGVGKVASLLPNWPRWARILVVVIFIVVVIMVILVVGG